MASNNRRHVVPGKGGDWSIKKPAARAPAAIAPTQAAALRRRAKEIVTQRRRRRGHDPPAQWPNPQLRHRRARQRSVPAEGVTTVANFNASRFNAQVRAAQRKAEQQIKRGARQGQPGEQEDRGRPQPEGRRA